MGGGPLPRRGGGYGGNIGSVRGGWGGEEGGFVVGDKMGFGVERRGGVAEGGEAGGRVKFEESLGVDVGSEVAGRGGAGGREGEVIFQFVVGEGLREKSLETKSSMEKLGWDKVEGGGRDVDRVGGN